MKLTGDEPAVPGLNVTYEDGSTLVSQFGNGLTIRQHFAAMAMQGLMANTEKTPMTDKELCEFSVRISDTLIAELNKEK